MADLETLHNVLKKNLLLLNIDPVFPMDLQSVDRIMPGLTKREYFASMAMQAILIHGRESMDADILTEEAVDYADLLIEALNK